MNSDDPHHLDETWLRNLPYSGMVYPNSWWDRIKYFCWRIYTPFHPLARDILLASGVVWHEGRQDFLLGQVAPHLSVKEFISYVVEQGYGNHFVAWKDAEEVASLRYVENFACQYHLRVFADREVRAHYEYTPECYPILHMREKDMQPRRDEFLKVLGDTIVVHN